MYRSVTRVCCKTVPNNNSKKKNPGPRYACLAIMSLSASSSPTIGFRKGEKKRKGFPPKRHNPGTAESLKPADLTVLWQLPIFQSLALRTLTANPSHRCTRHPSEVENPRAYAEGRTTTSMPTERSHSPRSVRAACSGIQPPRAAEAGAEGKSFRSRKVLICLRGIWA